MALKCCFIPQLKASLKHPYLVRKKSIAMASWVATLYLFWTLQNYFMSSIFQQCCKQDTRKNIRLFPKTLCGSEILTCSSHTFSSINFVGLLQCMWCENTGTHMDIHTYMHSHTFHWSMSVTQILEMKHVTTI